MFFPRRSRRTARPSAAITDKMGWTFTAKDKNKARTQEAVSTWRMNWFVLIPIFFGVIAAISLIVPLVFVSQNPSSAPQSGRCRTPRPRRLAGAGADRAVDHAHCPGAHPFLSSVGYSAPIRGKPSRFREESNITRLQRSLSSFELFSNILFLAIPAVVLVLFYTEALDRSPDYYRPPYLTDCVSHRRSVPGLQNARGGFFPQRNRRSPHKRGDLDPLLDHLARCQGPLS